MSKQSNRLPSPTDVKGVYCLETESWYNRKDPSTIEPVLQLLRHMMNVPYLHKDVATSAEFTYFLKQYAMKGFKTHPILYLGFHGFSVKGKAGISLNEPREMHIGEIEDCLRDKLRGRLVYFGSCDVMKAETELQAFRSNTKAGAILGYTKQVDWIESASFDMMVLSILQSVSFTKHGYGGVDRRLQERSDTLYKKLGFKIIY